jgi:hypothetical protein
MAGMVVLGLGLGSLAPAGMSAAAGTAPQRVASPLSRSAHVAYQGCPSKDVVLTVTLSARTYGLGQNVHYMVRLHNLSATRCAGATPAAPGGPLRVGPLSVALGPCGSLPLWITDSRRAPVFPNTGGVSCPLLLGPPLAPHATLRTAGTWDRVEGGLRPARIPRPAPPGRYQLVVGRGVSLPFTLTNAPSVAALTTDTLGDPPSAAEAQAGGLPAIPIG